MEIKPGKNGINYAERSGILIHSPYDPNKEAERFISANVKGSPGVFILAGPGLGYINRVIRRHYPETRIISVEFNDCFIEQTRDLSDHYWSPNSAEPLSSFLFSALSETDLGGLKYLEWPPSAKAYPEEARSTGESIREIIKQLSGNIFTTSFFGKKWLRNLIKNFLLVQDISILSRKGDIPIIIAASGPSLKESLPLIQSRKGTFLLLSLPSSLTFINQHGVSSDIAVSTDPGYYAGFHLYYCNNSAGALAAPLTSVSGPAFFHHKLLALNQDSIFENFCFNKLGYNGLVVPSHGTVAGTALYLALNLTEGPIFFSGLDLAWKDLTSHIKPHTFDSYIYKKANRLCPAYSSQYLLSRKECPEILCGEWRISPSLQIYRNWFSRKSAAFRERLYQIRESSPPIPGIPSLSTDQARKFLSDRPRLGFPSFSSAPIPCRENRTEILNSLLDFAAHSLERIVKCGDTNTLNTIISENTTEYKILSQINIIGLLELRKKSCSPGNRETLSFARELAGQSIDFLNSFRDRIKVYGE